MEFGSPFQADGEALELVEERCGATGRRSRPSAAAPAAASNCDRSRIPAPGAARTGCPAGRAVPAAAAGLSGQGGSSGSISARRSSSTILGPGSHTFPNGRIGTPVTADLGRSTRSCYELYDRTAAPRTPPKAMAEPGVRMLWEPLHWRGASNRRAPSAPQGSPLKTNVTPKSDPQLRAGIDSLPIRLATNPLNTLGPVARAHLAKLFQSGAHFRNREGTARGIEERKSRIRNDSRIEFWWSRVVRHPNRV